MAIHVELDAPELLCRGLEQGCIPLIVNESAAPARGQKRSVAQGRRGRVERHGYRPGCKRAREADRFVVRPPTRDQPNPITWAHPSDAQSIGYGLCSAGEGAIAQRIAHADERDAITVGSELVDRQAPHRRTLLFGVIAGA
jgi:hypothetical protein